jgi:segregation and condensation protein B
MTNDIRNKVEAILFSCGNKISITAISKIIGVNNDIVRNALLELKAHYENLDTALKIIDENEEWKMSVKDSYINLVRSIATETELPRAILETLAVIAWKAPLLQSDLIRLRNNKAYEHIAELEKSGFINKERFGRSYKIKLAQKFYDYFDVENVKKLRTDLEETADTAEKKALDEPKKEEQAKEKPKTETAKEKQENKSLKEENVQPDAAEQNPKQEAKEEE